MWQYVWWICRKFFIKIKDDNSYEWEKKEGLWCLTPLSTIYYSYIVAVSFMCCWKLKDQIITVFLFASSMSIYLFSIKGWDRILSWKKIIVASPHQKWRIKNEKNRKRGKKDISSFPKIYIFLFILRYNQAIFETKWIYDYVIRYFKKSYRKYMYVNFEINS